MIWASLCRWGTDTKLVMFECWKLSFLKKCFGSWIEMSLFKCLTLLQWIKLSRDCGPVLWSWGQIQWLTLYSNGKTLQNICIAFWEGLSLLLLDQLNTMLRHCLGEHLWLWAKQCQKLCSQATAGCLQLFLCFAFRHQQSNKF